MKRGAHVRLARIPREPGVNGPDDYIAAHGAEAFLRLLDYSLAELWPEPQSLVVTLEPVAYPLDALPDSIRSAVEEVLGFTKASIPLVASSALAALSTAIQAHVDVARADKLSGPVSLLMKTSADSGERKSTCDEYFSSAIRTYDKEQAELAKPEQKRHAAEFAAWKVQCVKAFWLQSNRLRRAVEQ